MKNILIVKLTCATLLLATLLPASARQPLPVTQQDAQLISYFRSYAPAAEVMTKKSDTGIPANSDTTGMEKNAASKKASATGNATDGDRQGRMNEAGLRDDRLVMPPAPQLPQ
ncbi:hypothetical protein ACO0K9_21575 [Undibacterium sp. Ji50W]|uniref:hypothetical protein n=1 Tax=Undibacterium sp. Ji50W TaxID=3413041 RepID=UPI003BF2783A